MEKSDIYKKLFRIQSENLVFTKNAINPYFNSLYLPLDELLKELKPVLAKYGVLIVHYTKDNFVFTEVRDIESDTFIVSSFPLNPNLKPQEIGSAISYAKRYNLGQIFNIVTDEDNDANEKFKRQTTKKQVEPDYLKQVKKMLNEMGAETEKEALNLLKSKTGLVWTSFQNITPAMAQKALALLLKASQNNENTNPVS